MKNVHAWDTGNNKTYVTYSNDKGHASQMSFKTTQNNVAYEILKIKFIANILCWASLLWVFVVKKIFLCCFFENDIQFVYIFINKVCTDMLLQILYCFYKKKCLLLYQSIHWSPLTVLPFLRMFYRILYIK